MRISFQRLSTQIHNLKVNNILRQHKRKFFYAGMGISVGTIASISTPEFIETRGSRDALENPTKLVVRNLVFRGGGPKGTVYIGALEELKKKLGGNLNSIERVAGTSAGAIMATLLAVGYQPEEIHQLLQKKSFEDFLRQKDEDKPNDGVLKIAKTLSQGLSLITIFKCLYYLIRYPSVTLRFFNQRSISDGENFRIWIEEVISKKVAQIETGSEANYEQYQHLTFGKLAQLIKKEREGLQGNKHYRDLYIVGAIYSPETRKLMQEVFSTEETSLYEHYIIADCVRISMSIPFVFSAHSKFIRNPESGLREPLEPSEYQCLDGGVLGPKSNYPIHLFDKNKYLSKPSYKRKPSDVVENWETLGFNLYNKHLTEPLAKWIIRTIGIINNPPAQPETYFHDFRDILIDVRKITLFDFSISHERTEELVSSGKDHVNRYWETDGRKLFEKQKKNNQLFDNENEAVFHACKMNTNLVQFCSEFYIVPSEYKELKPYIEGFNINSKKGMRRLAITGISGTGKKSLAYYCAQKYIEDRVFNLWKMEDLTNSSGNLITSKLPMVWVLNANTEESLRIDFENLIYHIHPEKMKIVHANLKKSENIRNQVNYLFSEVQLALKRFPEHLLIFSNVTDEEPTESCIRASTGDFRAAQIVITQDVRSKKPIHYDTTVNLNDGLNLENAKQLLSELSGIPFSNIPDQLFDKDKLGRRPYDLHVAGHYLKQGAITFQKFMEDWDKNSQLLLTDKPTLDLSISKAEREPHGDIAADVLFFCSFLNSNSISENLLRAYIKEKFSRKSDFITGSEEGILRDALSVMQKYGWIWQESKAFTYKIHPITQKEVRDHYRAQRDLLDQDMISALNESAKQAVDKSEKQQLLLHAEEMMSLYYKINSPVKTGSIKSVKTGSIKLADLMTTTAQIHLDLNNVQRGATLLKQALSIFGSHNQSEYIQQVSDISLKLGRSLAILGDYENSMLYLDQARDLYEKRYKTTHRQMGEVLVHLACAYAEAKQTEKGLKAGQLAYSNLKHHYGEKSFIVESALEALVSAGYSKADIICRTENSTAVFAQSQNSQILFNQQLQQNHPKNIESVINKPSTNGPQIQ